MDSHRRQIQNGWTGEVQRPTFVVVHRDHQSFPGVLFEWRLKRDHDGSPRRSARVVYMDADKVLRQSWSLENCVEPAPHSVAQRPRMAG